jgi:hypothetical protein
MHHSSHDHAAPVRDDSLASRRAIPFIKAAGLPLHFSPHCLRHTFASLLLQQGESAQFVQEKLGHKSLEVTTGTYGRWLPKRPIRGGVNALDEPSGSKVVAEIKSGTPDAPEVPDLNGGPSRTRTLDPLIKSLRTHAPRCNPLQATP